MDIKADKQVKFELNSNDMLIVRNFANKVTYDMRDEIGDAIKKVAVDNQQILDNLNRQLSIAENKMAVELGKIDDVLGDYVEVTSENGNKKMVRSGGTLKEAQQKVKEIEKEFNNAIRESNFLEKKSHAYEMEKEKLELMKVSNNLDPISLKEQESKVDSLFEYFQKHEEAVKKTDEIFARLQEAKNELNAQEDIANSFKHVSDDHLEFDRDTAEKTNDNLGHYISTHWGAKVKRLRRDIGMLSNLMLKGYDDPNVINKFQNAFNENTANIIFNGCIQKLKFVTNQMYFTGFEFSEYDKLEFIDEVLREMPRDMTKGFNPFFVLLSDESQHVVKIEDENGNQKKILDLTNIDPKNIVTNYCAFVMKHFEVACQAALKQFKEKREIIVHDWTEDWDDDSEGYLKSDKINTEELTDEDSYSIPGAPSNDYNPNRIDSNSQDFWKELSAYMLMNIQDMAQDATISMRDYLPKKAYLMMIPEKKAIEEVVGIYRKLIAAADAELSHGRPIAQKLKSILLYALGGAGNFDELEIEYNAIYAAFELYMYKFMLASEEANRDDGNGWRTKRNERVIENLKNKIDNAQLKLNDLELADYAFNACRSINNTRMEEKINFLLNNNGKVTDGSGKDNNFIIDPHPQRG